MTHHSPTAHEHQHSHRHGAAEHNSHTVAALTAIGGALLVVAAFLPWVSRGAGSTVPLREIGDLLLADRFGVVPTWLGVLPYTVPLAGAVAIVAAGLRRTTTRRITAACVLVAGALVVATPVLLVQRDRAPAGGWAVAAAGEALLVVALAFNRRNPAAAETAPVQ